MASKMAAILLILHIITCCYYIFLCNPIHRLRGFRGQGVYDGFGVISRGKELGLNALSCSISGYQKKTFIVKLKTFHAQNAQPEGQQSRVQQARVMRSLPFFV